MTTLRTLALTLFVSVVCAAPAAARQVAGPDDVRILSSGALDAAVAAHETTADRQRAELADLLARPEVRDLVRDHGIDPDRVEAAAAALTDDEVAAVAPLIANATAALQQRGISISYVSVIIILALVIILILLVR